MSGTMACSLHMAAEVDTEGLLHLTSSKHRLGQALCKLPGVLAPLGLT